MSSDRQEELWGDLRSRSLGAWEDSSGVEILRYLERSRDMRGMVTLLNLANRERRQWGKLADRVRSALAREAVLRRCNEASETSD